MLCYIYFFKPLACMFVHLLNLVCTCRLSISDMFCVKSWLIYGNILSISIIGWRVSVFVSTSEFHYLIQYFEVGSQSFMCVRYETVDDVSWLNYLMNLWTRYLGLSSELYMYIDCIVHYCCVRVKRQKRSDLDTL